MGHATGMKLCNKIYPCNSGGFDWWNLANGFRHFSGWDSARWVLLSIRFQFYVIKRPFISSISNYHATNTQQTKIEIRRKIFLERVRYGWNLTGERHLTLGTGRLFNSHSGDERPDPSNPSSDDTSMVARIKFSNTGLTSTSHSSSLFESDENIDDPTEQYAESLNDSDRSKLRRSDLHSRNAKC